MIITSITTELLALPPHRRIVDAIQEFETMEIIAVTLGTDEGVAGLGYSYTIGRGGRAVKALLDDCIVPIYLGADPERSTELWERTWSQLHWVGRQGIVSLALSAMDIAVFDLRARGAELPLYRYLGASRSSVPAYDTDGGWLNHGEAELVAEATMLVQERGFKGIKMKVGLPSRAADAHRVAAVRRAIGPDVPLMVDANMRWTPPEAIARAARFAEHDLFWFEEPIEADDVAGHAALAAHTSTPIAVGESLYNRYAFKEFIEQGAAGILQPDVGRVGGITEWLRVAAAAHTFGLSVSPHFLMELHVHLACAVPNALFVEHIPFLDRFVQEPLVPRDGVFVPPERPGHGVAFVEEKVAPYRRESTEHRSEGKAR